MKFEKKRSDVKQEIPTSSMPDIIFMLLLFFMVATVLKQYSGLKVKLPLIQNINPIEKRVLEWDGAPSDMPTKDKQYRKLKIKDSYPTFGSVIMKEFKLTTILLN